MNRGEGRRRPILTHGCKLRSVSRVQMEEERVFIGRSLGAAALCVYLVTAKSQVKIGKILDYSNSMLATSAFLKGNT